MKKITTKKPYNHKYNAILFFSVFCLALFLNANNASSFVAEELMPKVFDEDSIDKTKRSPLSWTDWKAGQTYAKDVKSGLLISRVSFEAYQDAKGVIVQVDGLKNKPESISPDPSGEVYGYTQIAFNKNAYTNETTIYFKIGNDWMTSNGLGASDIMVQGYQSDQNSWMSFETSFEEGTGIFSSTMPSSIKVFGITGSGGTSSTEEDNTQQEQPQEPPQDQPEQDQTVDDVTEEVIEVEDPSTIIDPIDAQPEDPMVPEDEPQTTETEVEGMDSDSEGSNMVMMIIIAIILLAAGIGGGYYYYENYYKKKGMKSEKPKSE